MTENRKKRSGWLGTLSLFVLLVALPGVGWFYLNKGLKYSKEVFEQIEPKTHLDSLDYTLIPTDLMLEELRGHALLLVSEGAKSHEEKIDLLYAQFSENPNFSILWFERDNEDPSWSKMDDKSVYSISSKIDLSDVIADSDMLLIDSNGSVRAAYNSDTVDWKSIAQHLAYVTPREEKEGLSVKRK